MTQWVCYNGDNIKFDILLLFNIYMVLHYRHLRYFYLNEIQNWQIIYWTTTDYRWCQAKTLLGVSADDHINGSVLLGYKINRSVTVLKFTHHNGQFVNHFNGQLISRRSSLRKSPTIYARKLHLTGGKDETRRWYRMEINKSWHWQKTQTSHIVSEWVSYSYVASSRLLSLQWCVKEQQ